MTREEVVKEVNALFHEGFEIPVEKLESNANLFEDLGLDSLDAVDMMVHLEDKFSIRVDGEKVQSIRTMDDVYNLVMEIAKSQ